ncbi:MAG TPA: Tol-Pal system beta propeller repeat protein TolB [Coxiellaceae bacterium]|nr:Tol-Pal system beta propeller repeat protein TolB [Coxiellaceae bacterium]
MFKKITIIASLLSVSTLTHATLDLELTQGMSSAVPLGLAPFSQPDVGVPGDETFTQVIQNDLEHSGQFRIIRPQNGLSIASVNQLNFEQWRHLNVNDVVIGQLQNQGGSYNARTSLVDIYHNPTQTLSNSVLDQWTFNTPPAGLRRLAHRISDVIYEKLTGVKGNFSTHIAYVLVRHLGRGHDQYRLEMADADGFNPRPLLTSSEPIMSPVWTPDGRGIAYVSFENHRAAIYEQDLATGGRRKISNAPGINGAPAFSPDKRQMALVLSVTGQPKLYLLNLSTQKLTQLTSGPSIDTEPAFSPDGQSLLFTSDRGGTPQIYRYDLRSAQMERITYSGNYNARAAYLPNGQSIIMMHRDGDEFGIAKQDLSTGRVTVLTPMGQDESPSLAPNGQMVLYATRNSAGRGVLGMVSLDGRVRLQLPSDSDWEVQEPAWGP